MQHKIKRIACTTALLAAIAGASACAPGSEQQARDIAELTTRGFTEPAFYRHAFGGPTQYSVGFGDHGCRIIVRKTDRGWRYGRINVEISAAVIEAGLSGSSDYSRCFSEPPSQRSS